MQRLALTGIHPNDEQGRGSSVLARRERYNKMLTRCQGRRIEEIQYLYYPYGTESVEQRILSAIRRILQFDESEIQAMKDYLAEQSR